MTIPKNSRRALAGLALASLLAAPLAARAQQGTPVMSRRISTGTTVQVTLLRDVNSGTAHVGQRVRARVAPDDHSGLPAGMVLVGRVTEVRAATNREAGVLNIQFTTPRQGDNGQTGYLPSNYDQDQEQVAGLPADNTTDGGAAPADTFQPQASARLVGKTPSSDKSSKYATIGAGVGAIIGLGRKGKIGDAAEGAILGGAGGYAANAIQKHPASDVNLAKGSEIAIHLDTPLTVRTEIVAPY